MVSDSDSRTVVVVMDEIWPPEQVHGDRNWMYLGSLFIDTRFLDDVCNAFLNARYACDGWETVRTDEAWREGKRDEFNGPVTFDRCDAGAAYQVAKRWSTLVRQRFAVTDQLNTRITGVDMNRVSAADTEDAYRGVYSQVLREHLIDARTHFFGESIHVDYDQIYRRHTGEHRDTAFDQVLSSISDPLTGIGDLTFLPDDHRRYEPGTWTWRIANLLQLTSTLTGSAANLFTDHHMVHRKARLAWLQNDLVQDSMNYEEPAADRFSIAFYPKPGTDDQFYYWRDIQRSDPHRESLERFL